MKVDFSFSYVVLSTFLTIKSLLINKVSRDLICLSECLFVGRERLYYLFAAPFYGCYFGFVWLKYITAAMVCEY